MWKLWGGERTDPLFWTSLVPKALTVHVSTWAGKGLLLEGKVHPLPGFVPGNLDSQMKGVWGLYPNLSVSLLGCFSPDAKGTSQCCCFLSFSLCSQRCFGFPEWRCPAFPEVQCLHCSKVLHPFKSCIFLDILNTLSNLSHLYKPVSYLKHIFISATIFLIPLKDPYCCLLLSSRIPFFLAPSPYLRFSECCGSPI